MAAPMTAMMPSEAWYLMFSARKCNKANVRARQCDARLVMPDRRSARQVFVSALSRDGRLAAWGCSIVRIMDVRSGELMYEFEHTSEVRHADPVAQCAA